MSIVSRIGLRDAVGDGITTEAGWEFMYLDGLMRASFRASGNVEAQSEVTDSEDLRSDRTKVHMDATTEQGHTTYVFDECGWCHAGRERGAC